jgi:membrane fusion protein, multidrug efflux system
MSFNIGDAFATCRSRNVIAAGLLLALSGAAVAASDKAKSGSAAVDAPPPSVVVAAVETKAIERTGRFIGNIKAIQSVDLMARVEGFLEKVAFDQGAMVEQGQLLYQIEQAQYRANLDGAEGQAAAAQADSASASANLEDKQADFERQSALLKKGDTSKTAFDQARAARDEAQADVQKAAASQQQAAAAVETAKINLGYTTITSPIKGRIGATTYTVGNLVNSSSGTLATVVQLDPIRAVFSIPSADFVRIMSQVGGQDVATYRARFVPELILPTGQPYDHKGKIAFSDNQVDASTGTVAVYADFPNPQGLLLPGQFVTAVVRMADEERLPVVPAAALLRTRDGEQVYVVGQGNRVELRQIKTGAKVDQGYAVLSGLIDGELVIVSGVQKVKPGMVVQPSRENGAAETRGQDDAVRDDAGNTGAPASRSTSADAAVPAKSGAQAGAQIETDAKSSEPEPETEPTTEAN